MERDVAKRIFVRWPGFVMRRNKICQSVLSASIGIQWAKIVRAWAGGACTAMDEPTSLKFVNRRIGELTKKYAAAQTADARTSAIEELSQLRIVRDELKKIQRKVYTADQSTERPKIETLFREMDKLARQMTEARRETRDRSQIVNDITRLSFLADALSKSKNSQ